MGEYAVFAALGGFFLFLILILIALYLVDAIARYKYLKVRNYTNAWMGFIPVANIYACVEATYGPVNFINLYGWRAPATLIKLWGLVTYALTFVCNQIPYVGGVLSLVITVINVAVLVQIFMDMMERLDDPQTTGFAILANIISIIASVKLLTTAGSRVPGSQNWQADPRVLSSQKVLNGPLSFMNGSSNTAQTGYTYTNTDPNAQGGYTPVTPVAPVVPPVPGTPAAPEAPVAPETPVQGFAPETPAAPVAPEAPAAPEAPVAPEAPAAPELTFTTDIPASDASEEDKQ